jgi:4-hydroxy-4-methyl-2-oxoglutarate aldolase
MMPPVAAMADAGASVPGAAIRHIAGPTVLCGPAYTVALPVGDNLGLHLAVAWAHPGDVLVATMGEEEYGPWGDILSAAALAAGLAGLVLNGYVRDPTAINACGFPVFARGVALRNTVKSDPGRHGVPVSVAGVEVNPGDLVVGDADGLVVVPSTRLTQVLTRAQEIAAGEEAMRAAIARGQTTIELLGLEEQERNLRNKEKP